MSRGRGGGAWISAVGGIQGSQLGRAERVWWGRYFVSMVAGSDAQGKLIDVAHRWISGSTEQKQTVQGLHQLGLSVVTNGTELNTDLNT